MIWMFSAMQSQAQEHALTLNHAWYNYSWKKLNNPNNINNLAGNAIGLQYWMPLKKSIGWHVAGYTGILSDLTDIAQPFDHATFMELNVGIHTTLFGTRQAFKRIIPNIQLGYSFGLFEKNASNALDGLQTAVYFGLGADIQIKHQLRLFASISSNQKLSDDFRTYLKPQIGLMARF